MRLAFSSLWLVLALAGCRGAPSVAVRVAVVGEDPFLGADAIAIWAEDEGGPMGTTLLAVGERRFEIAALPFDVELRICVESRFGALPLARGCSLPFSVDASTGAPSRSPDVTLGLLGRHAPVGELPPGAEVIAISATDEGAAIATEDALYRFVAHGADGRPHVLAPAPLPEARRGGALVALGARWLAVGGASEGVSLLDAEGSELASAPVPLRSGAALAAIDGRAFVLGGVGDDGVERADVLSVRVIDDALLVEPLAPLPAPRTDARAVPVLAASPTGPASRLLVVDGSSGGAPDDEVLVLDPSGTSAPMRWHPPAPLRASAIASIETGQVLLLGGTDGAAVRSDVRLLFVRTDRALELLSPAPDPLFRARRDAVAVPYARGTALVVGGTDELDRPVELAELASLEVLPGSVRLTGGLPVAGHRTVAAALDDGSILVVSGQSATLYFPFPTAP